jgi:hypothetical protein
MNRSVMSRASAEMQLGSKLSEKLSAARSPSDAVSAYQEWLTEEMAARSEDARYSRLAVRNLLLRARDLFRRWIEEAHEQIVGDACHTGK